jgi:D-alanyl-D-alanine carboxypeptidase
MFGKKASTTLSIFIMLITLVAVPAHAASKTKRKKINRTEIAKKVDSCCDIRRSRQYAAIVMNASNGDIIYHTNAHNHRYPASLTKMMTLYLVFEQLQKKKISFDTKLRISAKAASAPPSKLGLKKGDVITVREAVMALIVKSANDAAVAIAENLAGSEWNFARHMNLKARNLHMNRTAFKNASGLHNPKQVSTAYDLALLSIALRRDFPEFYPLFAKTEFKFKGAVIKGHNRVLERYAYADGLKTGFINASGFNLATSANDGKTRLVAVVLGGQTAKVRDDHMIALLEKSYMQLRPITYIAKNSNKITENKKEIHSPFHLLDKELNAIVSSVPQPSLDTRKGKGYRRSVW